MSINKSVKEIQSYLADFKAEINIDLDGNEAEIYWENLRVKVNSSEFEPAMEAIKTLIKLEAYFA